jgi:hypothetical protein
MDKTQASDVQISEINIPKSLRETAFSVVIFSIVIFFVLLAILELLLLNYIFDKDQRLIALIPSVLLLVFIFFQVRGSCRYDGGVRQFMIKVAGIFAPHQFAEITRQDTGRKMLCFGYQLFRKRFYYIKILCDGIKTVDWGSGQASSLAGYDMDDWQVVVWFDKDLATTLNWNSSNTPRFDLHIVGPPQTKQKTEELGRLFIELLRNAGVIATQYNDAALQGLVGTSGITSCGLFPPIGKVRLGEYEYYAHSAKGIIDKDTKVMVIEKRGLSLYVAPIAI